MMLPADPLDRFQCRYCGEHFVVPSLRVDHELICELRP